MAVKGLEPHHRSPQQSSKRNQFGPITQMNKLRPRKMKKCIQRDPGERKGAS